MTWSSVVSLAFVLGCGDDGPPSSGGSGDGSSGAVDSSTSGIGATSLATGSDSGSTSSSGSSTSSLDDTTTGAEVVLCDVCAETDVCVLAFHEKNCIFCDDLLRLPLDVVCVPRAPEACDDALTHTRACTLALCGSPYASEYGCECGEQGDFICGVSQSGPPDCDYWDPRPICGPDAKCVPARDELDQPLPYTECVPPAVEPLPIGAPCTVELGEDPCEQAAYCDEIGPDSGMGTCRALCVGTVDMPSCTDPGESCVPFAEGQPEFGGVCRPA